MIFLYDADDDDASSPYGRVRAIASNGWIALDRTGPGRDTIAVRQWIGSTWADFSPLGLIGAATYLWRVDDGNIWLTRGPTDVWYWDSASWHADYTPPYPFYPLAVQGDSTGNLYLVLGNQAAGPDAYTTNTGGGWDPAYTTLSGAVTGAGGQIWYTPPSGGLHVPSNARIREFLTDTDEYVAPLGHDVTGVWVPAGYGYGIQDGSTVLSFGGTTWTTLGSQPSTGDPTDTIYLGTVHGTGASDVWVGAQIDLGSTGTLAAATFHWDGAAWTYYLLRSPDPGEEEEALQVWADASNDVWAGGSRRYLDPDLFFYVFAPRMWHWDGAAWTERSPSS